MSMETVRSLLDGLLDSPEEHHTICLHGGEPLLAGKRWFSEFIDVVKQHPLTAREALKVGVQSNGLAIDREWARLFAEAGVDVSLSVDGPAPVHDAFRRYRNGKATLDVVLRAVTVLREAGIKPSGIAVVTKKSIELGAGELFGFFCEMGLREIDFTPYIETDCGIDASGMEASAEELLAFYRELFDRWLVERQPAPLRIRTFEQTVGAVLGYYPTVCNMHIGEGCGRIPSVMPNGEVFACDLDPAVVDVRLGFLDDRPLSKLLDPAVVSELRERIKASFQSLGCGECEVAGMCGMTCPRYSLSGRSFAAYCGFARSFVAYVRGQLDRVARELYDEGIEFGAGNGGQGMGQISRQSNRVVARLAPEDHAALVTAAEAAGLPAARLAGVLIAFGIAELQRGNRKIERAIKISRDAADQRAVKGSRGAKAERAAKVSRDAAAERAVRGSRDARTERAVKGGRDAKAERAVKTSRDG